MQMRSDISGPRVRLRKGLVFGAALLAVALLATAAAARPRVRRHAGSPPAAVRGQIPAPALRSGTGSDGVARSLQSAWFSGFLVGGVVQGRFVGPASVAPLLAGGEVWRLYDLHGCRGAVVGGPPRLEQGPGEWYDVAAVASGAASAAGQVTGSGAVAVAARFDPLPRPVVLQTANLAPYEAETRHALCLAGLASAPVVVRQVVRADLDGNGSEEVIVVAGNVDGRAPVFVKNTYMRVSTRRVVPGGLDGEVLFGEFHHEDRQGEADGPNEFCVLAVLDLDGDGRLEVVLRATYYEGTWLEVWKAGRDGRLRRVLSEGVGA